MIDPITSLASTIQSNPGRYALLLGSGLSRSAQIPTGWDVILDLVQRVAVLEGAGYQASPERWYAERFGAPPNYSSLLEQLAKTQTERNQLIRNFFEATHEDRERGAKLPTQAHKSIAQLVEREYVRLILTTNFDSLIEDALADLGVKFTVIASPDALDGALPITHAGVTVYKLHGDYRDTRSMNTQEELSTYDPRVETFLDRVFDEFGLLVCGWSAEWDLALRDAFKRCSSRRFATYWIARGTPKQPASEVIQWRDAVLVEGYDADEFFSRFNDRVVALDQYLEPHPLSVLGALAEVKRFIADDRHRIRLFDLVTDEATELKRAISTEPFTLKPMPTADSVLERVKLYEAKSMLLLNMYVTGCFWSGPQHDALWQRVLSRIGGQTLSIGGYSAWEHLSRYPALLLFYGGGISAVTAGRFHTLQSLMDASIFTAINDVEQAAIVLNPWDVGNDVAALLPGQERMHTPLHNWIFSTLRDPLMKIVPDEGEYEEVFDRFEYLLCLYHVDRRRDRDVAKHWAPVGRFAWKHHFHPEASVWTKVNREIEEQGIQWPPLTHGMFGASLERVHESVTDLLPIIEEFRRRWL